MTTKLMTLVAIAAITLGSPEIRSEKGKVLAKSTRRDVEPGTRFECDEEVAEELKGRQAARDPIDDADGVPQGEEVAIRAKSISDSLAQAAAAKAAQELAEANAIAEADAERVAREKADAEAKEVADALAAAAAATAPASGAHSQAGLDLDAPAQ